MPDEIPSLALAPSPVTNTVIPSMGHGWSSSNAPINESWGSMPAAPAPIIPRINGDKWGNTSGWGLAPIVKVQQPVYNDWDAPAFVNSEGPSHINKAPLVPQAVDWGATTQCMTQDFQRGHFIANLTKSISLVSL